MLGLLYLLKPHIANPMTTAPPTTATTSFQTLLVALATPACNPGSPARPVADAAGAPTPPPVMGASTTVMLVKVPSAPSGRVKVDRTVELEGEKEMTSDVSSMVVSLALEPLLAETEKTTRPLEVAMGVAEEGVVTGTAWVVGALVAVVRDEAGAAMPDVGESSSLSSDGGDVDVGEADSSTELSCGD